MSQPPSDDTKWIMLGLDVVKQNVIVLGFHSGEKDKALEIAKERAEPHVFLESFDLLSPLVGRVYDWMIAHGMPKEEAKELMGKLGKVLLTKVFPKMKPGKKRKPT